ncbi:hypothetical protein KC571_01685 [candidate division WWE3 bacterium]|uniref:YbaK/aminoacyl-tRNA synthetase-associated domain-containing protein n=1 Tax=candidate division WWE3 bacterium TaxID=2053526 RepID=A0A955LGS5_UNCKA|nr:hypothetical protein [candidate division WWE3 bacterium]
MPDTDTLYDRIVTLLRNEHIRFSESDHDAVFTSAQAAETRGTELRQGAKAILCLADKNPILIVISGKEKIDSKKFKSLFGIKDLRFATHDEVSEITGVAVGAVPPFGSLIGIKTYVDVSLSQNEKIAYNPGLHTKTIIMLYEDYILAERPLLGDFSQ